MFCNSGRIRAPDMESLNEISQHNQLRGAKGEKRPLSRTVQVAKGQVFFLVFFLNRLASK